MAGAKTVTLNPPTDYGVGIDSIQVHPDPIDATKVIVEVLAHAVDPVTGITDQSLVTTSASKANATMQALASQALAAWKAAKGY